MKAQVILIDIEPDTTTFSGYELDIDGDDTLDLGFFASVQGGISQTEAIALHPGVEIAGVEIGFQDIETYPLAMSFGDQLELNETWIDGGVMGGDHPVIMEEALWPDQVVRFLGFKLNIDGDLHLGWVAVRNDSAYQSIQIQEYAYNLTPEQGLFVGSTDVISSLEAPIALSAPRFLVEPNAIRVMNSGRFTSISVFNIAGQRLLVQNIMPETSEQTVALGNDRGAANSQGLVLVSLNAENTSYSKLLLLPE